MMPSGNPPPQHTSHGGEGRGLFERESASEAELEERARLGTIGAEWGRATTKGIDTLRLATINVAGNMSAATDWLLCRAAILAGADVTAMQEVGAAQDDLRWAKELRGAAAATASTKDARVTNWSSHQANNGRWVGGVATVTQGETTMRSKDTRDVRGWGRYGVTTIRGRGGLQVAVVNVYIRSDAVTKDGTDCKLSTILRRKAEQAPRGVDRGKWTPGDVPPKPNAEQVKDPALLLWDDIEMALGKWATHEKHVLVIAGDLNVDPVRGDAGAARIAKLCDTLGLAHAADRRYDAKSARLITTRRGITDADGKVVQRPSHLDHVLVSKRATVTGYYVDAAATLGASDHAMVVVDLCMQDALGITEDGARAPKAVKRKIARARYADKWYREAFGAFAEQHYEKHHTRHGIEEAKSELDLTDEEIAKAAAAAKHTGEWNADRWGADEQASVVRSGWHKEEEAPAADLRRKVSDLARKLDSFAMAADAAFVCAGSAAARRKQAKEVGRGDAAKTVHIGKLWSQVKTVRLSAAEWSNERKLEFLRAPITTEGADSALPSTAEAAIQGTAWPGKQGSPVQMLATARSTAEVVDYLSSAERAIRQQLHGRMRERHTMDEGGRQAAKLRERKEQMKKEHVNRLLENKRAGVLSAIAVQDSTGGTRILREPAEQAKHTAQFAGPRFSTAQGKIFIKTDLRTGDRVSWGFDEATVKEAKQDGSFGIKLDDGSERTVSWAEVQKLNRDGSAVAAVPGGGEADENVLPMFRRTEEGAAKRQRMVDGAATAEDWETLPKEFREVESALRRKNLRGEPAQAKHYTRLYDAEAGRLRGITKQEWKQHLKRAVKGKAPGFTGMTTDLVAMMPDKWHDAALSMINTLLATGITPTSWHIDLVNYIHKGGEDQTLANFRPIKLLELMRKLVLGIITNRLQRDWEDLGLIDKTNSGFQRGRSTANPIMAIRAAMEQARADGDAVAVLYDDLKWAFDTPARTVIDLAARRMGVPQEFMQLLEDIDSRSVQTTILAAGLAMNLSDDGIFRQLHGTGQGGVEGPMLWLMISDIVVTRARQVDAAPAVLRTHEGWTKVGEKWFVDDSALLQVAKSRQAAANAVERLMNATGLLYVLLGMERRPTKCHLVITGGEGEATLAVQCKHWLSHWEGDKLTLVEGDPITIEQEPAGSEVRYLGLSDSEVAGTSKARAALTAMARRAAKVYSWTPSIQGQGKAFAQGVLAPKIAYSTAFSKATRAQLEQLEGTYGTMLRHALGVRSGTAWDVLEAQTGEAGAGTERLATVVLKQRLRHLLMLTYGGTGHEAAVSAAIVEQGQRWMGGPEHVLRDAPKLRDELEAEEGSGPWVIGLAAELARLGIAVDAHHEARPRRDGDQAIMSWATRRLGKRAKQIQAWRRKHGYYWASDIINAAGQLTQTARDRIEAERGHDAAAWMALREWLIDTQVALPRLGTPTTAAWADAAVGKIGAVNGELRAVLELGTGGAVTIALQAARTTTGRAAASRWAPTAEPRITRTDEPVLWTEGRFTGGEVAIVDAEEARSMSELEPPPTYHTRLAADEDARLPSRAAAAMRADSDGSDDEAEEEARATFRHYEWYYRREAATERPLAVSGVRLEHTAEFEAAVAAVRDAIGRMDERAAEQWRAATVCAYSDGSVEGNGVIGTAAMAIRIGEALVTMGVRLANFDVPLSSNRAEWGGALLVTAVLTEAGVTQSIELRLDNLNVVNTSGRLDDSAARIQEWMHLQDRDLAELFGWWVRKREKHGMGAVTTMHQPGHPERRKKREDFDEHEKMNDVADEATHRCHPNQMIYGNFARPKGGFRMWVMPEDDEGVERGRRVEVTGPPLSYIRKRAARLAARRRRTHKQGEFVASHMAAMMGWSWATKVPADSMKFYHGNLATEAVKNMYQGLPRNARCPCGKLYRAQSHGFVRCTLANVAGTRVKHVEAQRDAVLEFTDMVGVADEVAAAYDVDSGGVVGRGNGVRRGEDWELGAWPTGAATAAPTLGDTSGRTNDRGLRSWAEPRPGTRMALELQWSASKEYDHDGLLAEEDTRQGIHQRFKQYATMGGRTNWWQLRWTEMAVVYLAQMAQTDVGDTKKLARKLRKNTGKWWREAWNEWRAADVGLHGLDGIERKARLLDGWAAVRRLLGEDYRNEFGRKMAATATASKWTWVRLGQQLKQWTTAAEKEQMTATVLRDHDRHHEDWERVLRAGVKLAGDETLDEGEWDSEDSDSASEAGDEVIDMTDDITYLRQWDADGDRKRSAKEVACDDTETEEARQQARDWMEANAKRSKKTHKQGTKNRAGTRNRRGEAQRRAAATTANRHRSRPWSIQAPAMGGGAGGGGGGP